MLPVIDYVWYRLEGQLKEEAQKAFSGERVSRELIVTQNLGKPVYQITQLAPHIFAAESLFPQMLCLSIVKPHEYYAAMPIGFDGTHQIPWDGKRLNDTEEAHVQIGLFAGGHSSPAHPPIEVGKTRQVALPNEFHPSKHAYIPLCNRPKANSCTPS